MSCHLNYISKGPPIHRGVYLDNLEQFRFSFKNFQKKSVEDSALSRLCPISFNTFPKMLRHMEGYFSTIWNSLELVLGLLKKFRGMFRGTFVFNIVSFYVKRRSDDPQTLPE